MPNIKIKVDPQETNGVKVNTTATAMTVTALGDIPSGGGDAKKITITVDSIDEETHRMTSSTDLTSEEAKNIYANITRYKDSSDTAGLNRYLDDTLFFILDLSKMPDNSRPEGLDIVKNTMWNNVETFASGGTYGATISGFCKGTAQQPFMLYFGLTIPESGEVTTYVSYEA